MRSCNFPFPGNFIEKYFVLITKYKKMKPKILKLSLFCLVFALIGASCHDDDYDPLCYKGEVIQYGRSSCYDMIEIMQPVNNDDLVEGVTISFNRFLIGKDLEEGDIVYFKVLDYNKYEPQSSPQPCRFPQFLTQLEICTN